MQSESELKLITPAAADPSCSLPEPAIAAELAESSAAGPTTALLASPLTTLVAERLRSLICEAPNGTQLEALVRVAERLPEWQASVFAEAEAEAEIEGLSLEEAVSEVRRIADLAESQFGSKKSPGRH